MTSMSISPADIAALARVQRPVVSMWRSRFATGELAFPTAVRTVDGQDQFDALQVAEWLTSTNHGNNPDALADLVAFATPERWSITNPDHVKTLAALLALRVADGRPIASGDLTVRALAADPDDLMIAREVASRDIAVAWGTFVDQFIDAAYSPPGAWARLEGKVPPLARSGTAGPIAPEPASWLARLALALGDRDHMLLVDGPGSFSAREVIVAAANLADEAQALEVRPNSGDEGRHVHRYLVVHELSLVLHSHAPKQVDDAVHVVRLAGQHAGKELSELEDLVIEIGDSERAIVVGPATLLTDPLTGAAERSRDAMVRAGRVRAIVRLPEGWVATASRQSLAMWVIGGAQHSTPLADRFSVVGDLTGVGLTTTRFDDLISDILAGLGGASTARKHAFRFLRVVRTSTLVASGNLTAVAQPSPSVKAPRQHPTEIPALIDETLLAMADEAPKLYLQPVGHDSSAAPEKPTTISHAISSREVKVLAGTRLSHHDVTKFSGFPVIGRPEILQGAVGLRRIDRVHLLAEYPNAELTLPGDVVFLAGAHPRALVDRSGSSVVEYPARVLRLGSETLSPELAVADIDSQNPHSPWRNWVLHRVAVGQKAGLEVAIELIVRDRRAAEQRLAQLECLEHLLVSGVAAGTVSIGASTADDPETIPSRDASSPELTPPDGNTLDDNNLQPLSEGAI